MSNQAAPSVKICGLQSVEVLKSIVHLPIAYIGFVFAKSKRQVTAEQAGELIGYMQSKIADGVPVPLSAGVFVNPSLEELAHVLAFAPLDAVQLHGQESAEFCREVKARFGVQVFKVVSVQKSDPAVPSSEAVAAQLAEFVGTIDALLLDTHDPVYGGGSGVPFAWDCIPVYQEWARRVGVKLFVAGGLNPDNVGSLSMDYSPDGVDVSSGVETDGAKDIAKIIAFVERVTQSGAST
jgi:phosphoribosylanthranilate isomerase